jgi:hypothetical protein
MLSYAALQLHPDAAVPGRWNMGTEVENGRWNMGTEVEKIEGFHEMG